MTAREIVLCNPVRTAIGGYNGALKGVPATELGAVAVKATLARSGLNPEQVDSLVFGNVIQAGNKMNSGPAGGDPGRAAGDRPGPDRQPRLRLGRPGHRVGRARRSGSAFTRRRWQAAWRTWTARPI